MGVLFNSSLKFGNHINKILHKANRLLGLIKRTFSYFEPQMLRLLYTTSIRPHLDYACVIWNPYQLVILEHWSKCKDVLLELVQHFSIFHIMIDL